MSDTFADTELETFIREFYARGVTSAADTGADALRAGTVQRAKERPKGPELHQVTNVILKGRGPAVRIYRSTPDPTGVVVYFHGGGWTIGDLDTHDRACRRLCETSGVVIVAVDYRRAPEHPWPAAVDDGIAVIEWIATKPNELGLINGLVGVAGDSAGGLLAALVSHRLRDQAPTLLPTAQFLIYANTDLTNSGASMTTEGHGFGLEVADIEWFNEQWVPDRSMWTDPRVSPLFEPVLTGLPPTVVVTCEHDPLRDQGEQYAKRLTQAGVPVVLRREPGMVHNFMLWDLISPACAAASDRVAHDIAGQLS